MALIDDAISAVNATLLANLPWLDNAFGKIQRMRRKDAEGVDSTFPGAYKNDGTNDYVSVLPDEEHGNYCYWEVSDPVEYDNINRNFSSSFDFKISFWFKWPDIFGTPAYKAASIEEVKLAILQVLAAAPYTRQLETYKVYEDANSIFQNFTNQGYISAYDHKQLQGQFLMKPFGGVAFSGRIQSFLGCNSEGVSITVPQFTFSRLPVNYSLSEQLWPLETWFDQKMYWRTWNLGSGDNTLKTLTGLTPSNFVVKREGRATNAVSGAIDGWVPELVVDSGVYKVFAPDFWESIFITAFYLK